jgi:hypothetical protein
MECRENEYNTPSMVKFDLGEAAGIVTLASPGFRICSEGYDPL